MADDAALDALYQEIILDHYRRPRNFRELPNATCTADGRNPNCGDALTVWIRVDGDRVADVTFKGVGCAISKASASIMTDAVAGKSVADAGELFTRFHGELTGDGAGEGAAGAGAELPAKLKVFRGVRRYPMRVKCATLAWHAMREALGSE